MIESGVFVDGGGVTVEVVRAARVVVSGATTAVAAFTVSMDGSVSDDARFSGRAQPTATRMSRIVNRFI
jgi:stringent starvation protein B